MSVRKIALSREGLVHVLMHLVYGETAQMSPETVIEYAEGITYCGELVYNSDAGLEAGWQVRPLRPPMTISCLRCLGRK
jgi:hypothetical protein